MSDADDYTNYDNWLRDVGPKDGTPVIITWQSNYNGVSAHIPDLDHDPLPEVQDIFDTIADTFPTKLWEWTKECSCFEGPEITGRQEFELLCVAKLMLKDVVPDAYLEFKEDTFST